MERNQFSRFANDLLRLGATGVAAPEFNLGRSGSYALQYIPFEHVNRDAKLVIVGITPGNTQLSLAYETAQNLLRAGRQESEALVEIKKAGAFGGPSMKPNLLKMLRHFRFDKLLGIDDVESLWETNATLLHSTSVVPHAAFKTGKMFAGSFDEVMESHLLKECFLDCFVPSVREISPDALFVGLGPCPQAALEWCAQKGYLRREKVLGAFCHPSGAGGSTTRYYLREISREDLDSRNPVRNRCDWLNQAYEQMRVATSSLLGGSHQRPAVTRSSHMPVAIKPTSAPVAPEKSRREKLATPATFTPAVGDIATILVEFRQAGYMPTKETAKLAEFQLPNGQTIYLVKATSKLNKINLMVHPGLKPEVVSKLDGVEAVSDGYRYHSNMTRFPKRRNKGATEIAYARQVSLDTFADLSRFLSSFKAVTF